MIISSPDEVAARRLARPAGPSWRRPGRLIGATAVTAAAGVALVAASPAALAEGTPPVPTTVRATLGPDGTPTGTKTLKPDGNGGVSSTDFTGDLPLKMTVTPTVGGQPVNDLTKADGALTLAVHVENTSGTTQDVSYTASNGKTKKVQTLVALPLVGQLRMALPKGYTNVQAPGAAVRVDPDGTTRVLWSLVLFTPLGSPAADVSLTADAKGGAPAIDLQAATVNPSATPGLSIATTSANQTQTQADFLKTYAQGGDVGIKQLAGGLGQLVAGLGSAQSGAQQLATGLAAGSDGAQKLAAGARDARNGSGDLREGLVKINGGTQQLSTGLDSASKGGKQLQGGLKRLRDGNGSLADGTKKLKAGADQLAAGTGLVATGNLQLAAGFAGSTSSPGLIGGSQQLVAGLRQIDAGLGQLADPKLGLPAAGAGLTTVRDGLKQAVAGLGDNGDTSATTINGGLSQSLSGAQQLRDGVQQLGTGTDCALIIATDIRDGSSATPDFCYPVGNVKPVQSPATGATLVAANALITQLTTLKGGLSGQVLPGLGRLVAGLSQLSTGVKQLRTGLSSGSDANPGALEGVNQILAGTTTAVSGVTQLKAGTSAALTGAQQLSAGISQAGEGAQQLAAGSGLAAAGATQLKDGLGTANSGAQQLSTGSKAAYKGSGDLVDGLDRLDAGSRQLLAGTGAAATGSAQLNDGLKQLSAGQDQVAAGLPAAVTGSGQLASGLTQLSDGAKQAQAGARQLQTQSTGPLATQTEQISDNARQSLAVIQAAAAKATSDPMGSDVTYDLALSSNPQGLTNSAFDTTTRTGSSVELLGVAVLLVAGGSVPVLVRRRLRRRATAS